MFRKGLNWIVVSGKPLTTNYNYDDDGKSGNQVGQYFIATLTVLLFGGWSGAFYWLLLGQGSWFNGLSGIPAPRSVPV